MNAPTACFMFAHKTKGEHGLPPSRTESEALVCIGQYLAQSKSRECHNFGYIKLSTRTGCGDTPPLDNFRVAIYSIVKGRD